MAISPVGSFSPRPLPELTFHPVKVAAAAEIAKNTLAISQELSYHTADVKTLPLLRELRGKITDVKLQKSPETISALHSLKHQLHSLFQYTTHHDFPEKSAIASECGHLLAVLEPEKSLRYLKDLVQFHIHQRDYSAAVSVVLEMAPKLPKGLHNQILRYKNVSIDTRAKVSVVLKLCREALNCPEGPPLTPQHMSALGTLNEILTSESTTPLDSGAAAGIADLIMEACGNTKIHGALRAKTAKTPADHLLIDFSQATLTTQEAKNALSKLVDLLQEPTVLSARKEIHECQEALVHVRRALEDFELHLPTEITQDVKERLRGEISSLPNQGLSWNWILSSQSSLTSIETLLRQLPKGAVPEASLNVLMRAKDLALHLTSTVVPNINERIDTISPHKQLTRDDIFVLSRLAQLGPRFSLLQKVTSQSPLPHQFQELVTLVTDSATGMGEVNMLFQALPGYQPGDVLLDLEPLQKASRETVWSQERKRPGFHPTVIFRLAYQWIKHGFETIRPFFTGKATHASIVSAEQGVLTHVSVLQQEVRWAPLTFQSAMTHVGYRPSLPLQLTAQGKELLMNMHPPLTFDALASEYSKEVSQQELITRSINKRTPFLRKRDAVVSAEFVIHTVINSQFRVEKNLTLKLQEQGLIKKGETVHLFEPIIPPSFSTQSLDPALLRRLLKQAGASALKPPLALQLFVQRQPTPAAPFSQEPSKPEVDEKKVNAARISLSKALYDAKRALAPPSASASFIPQPTLSKEEAALSVQRELAALAPLLEYQPSLRAFVSNGSRLLQTFNDRPFMLVTFVYPLLRMCLVEGPAYGISTERGEEIAAMLLFLDAEGIAMPQKAFRSEKDFTSTVDTLQAAANAQIAKLCTQWKTATSVSVRSEEALQETALPLAIAKTVLLPDGTLNSGLIPLILKTFSSTPRTVVEEEIFTVLHEMAVNDALLAAFSALPSPKCNSLGQRIVNATLLQPYDTPITALDAKRAVLATLLTRWRQGDIGTCHVTSILQHVKDAALQWVLDDFSQILKEGFLVRECSGQKIHFYGLERMFPQNCDVPIPVSRLADVHKEPSVRCAIKAMGCTLEDFQEKALLAASDDCFTLRGAFELVEKGLPTAETAAGKEALERALFSLEAPTQPPLWRMWENCVSSMAFAPSSVDIPEETNPTQRLPYLNVLKNTILSMAFETGLRKLPGRLLRSLISLKLHLSSLATDPLLSGLSKIRYCYAPAQPPNAPYSTWTLAYESKDGLVVARSRDDVGDFLRNAWHNILKEAGVPPQKIDEISREVPSASFVDTFQKKATQTLGRGLEHQLPSQRVALSSTPILEGYRPSKPEKTIISVRGASGLKNFLQWAASERAQLGISPDATAVAITMFTPSLGHAFRLLPNHPSVVHCSPQEQSEKATEIFLHPASTFPYTRSLLTSEISSILSQHGIRAKSVMETALHNQSSKYDDYHLRSFEAYLGTLLTEVEKISHITFTQDDMASIDAVVLRGLLKDAPSYKASLIHFADTNWMGGALGHSVNLHFCFYFNPRTKQWAIVQAPDSDESSIRIHIVPIHKMYVEKVLPGIPQTIGTKHLLRIKEHAQHQLVVHKDAFFAAWTTFADKLLALSPYEKKALLVHFDTLLQTPRERLTEAEEALQNCLIAQAAYERTLQENITVTDPDVSEIRTTLLGSQRDAIRYLHEPEAIKKYIHSIVIQH